jgi:hypothetical protein
MKFHLSIYAMGEPPNLAESRLNQPRFERRIYPENSMQGSTSVIFF